VIRIVWLFLVGAATTILLVWAFIPAHVIANMAILSGAGNPSAVLRTIGMSRSWGSLTWILAMFFDGATLNALFSGIGIAAVLVLHFLAKREEDRDVSSRKTLIEDHPGGEGTSYVASYMNFHSLPTAYRPETQGVYFAKTKVNVKQDWITPLEKELLGILAAHPDWPADVYGYHKESLYQHSLNVWKKTIQICKQEGIDKNSTKGMLSRQLALIHDLGKLIAYQEQDGKWIKVSNRHEQLSLNVLRTTAAFWELPIEYRHQLEMAGACLLNHYNPLEEDPAVLTAIRIVKKSDPLATAESHNPSASYSATDASSHQETSTAEADGVDPRPFYIKLFPSLKDDIIEGLRTGMKSGPKKSVALADFPDTVFVDADTFLIRYLKACEENGLPKLSGSDTDASRTLLQLLLENKKILTTFRTVEARNDGIVSLKTSDLNLPRCICIEYNWPKSLRELVESSPCEYTLKGK